MKQASRKTREIAIELRALSKRFYLPHTDKRGIKSLFGEKNDTRRQLWALKNLSFSVPRGQVCGVVGLNGSGKSTLLKIVCGIMEPTCGEVRVSGRLSSLLELGVGFDPDFTGRENVYLNAALLGFSKKQVQAMMAGIEQFADIGSFMERPLRTYSSGMQVRLAFAVAVAAEPDILVIDEVLAVGDPVFRRKCMARIRDFAQSGKTILFVSHDLNTTLALCDQVLMLDQGELLCLGEPKTVIYWYEQYLYADPERRPAIKRAIRGMDMESPGVHDAKSMEPRRDTLCYDPRGAMIENPRLTDLSGKDINVLSMGRVYRFSYCVRFEKTCRNVRLGMMIRNLAGLELAGQASHPTEKPMERVEAGALIKQEFRFCCRLLPESYTLSAGVVGETEGMQGYLHRLVDVISFRVCAEKNLRATGMVDITCREDET